MPRENHQQRQSACPPPTPCWVRCCCSCRSAAVSPHQHCSAQRQSNKGKRKFLWICISETSEGPSALPLAPRATCVALALQTGTMGKREQRENPVWQIKRQMKRKQPHWWNRKYVRDRVRRTERLRVRIKPCIGFLSPSSSLETRLFSMYSVRSQSLSSQQPAHYDISAERNGNHMIRK